MSHSGNFLPLGLTVLGMLTVLSPAAAAQSPPQLDGIVAEALRNNLGLAQESLAVERAEAGVREARGRFFPELSLGARYSEQTGTLDLGRLVNPAYEALNQITGRARFPTDLALSFPMRHETRFRLSQPLFEFE